MNSEPDVIRWDYHLTPERPVRLFHYRRACYVREPRPDMHYAVHVGVMLAGAMEGHYLEDRLHLGPGDVWFTGPWEPHVDRGIGQPIGGRFLFLASGKGDAAGPPGDRMGPDLHGLFNHLAGKIDDAGGKALFVENHRSIYLIVA